MTVDRRSLFDDWAAGYDGDVAATAGFPVAGYEQALLAVVESAQSGPGDRVLDLGTGTGRLAALFADRECVVTGVDFSPAMLEEAARRVPLATLLRMDLLGDWAALAGQRFDVIGSGYVFHELEDTTKLDVIKRLRADHLADGGRLVIADIAFESRAALDDVRASNEGWDDEEHYWVVDEVAPALGRIGLQTEFRRVSFCAGVFSILA